MKLFLAITGLLFGGMFFTSKGDLHTEVAILNQIQGEQIIVHCFSGDDDIGTHVLGLGQNISWSFDINFFATTKFYCTFTTAHGCGNYAVYDQKLEARCERRCVWNVRVQGPCLIQTNDYDIEWCQNWKQLCGK